MASCFALTVFLMACDSQCSVALTHVLWVGLWCVILVFPDHIHLLFFFHLSRVMGCFV